MAELAEYRSREVVRAGRIVSIERQHESGDWLLVLEGGEHRDVGPEFFQEWDPEVGCWFVETGEAGIEIMQAGDFEPHFERIEV